MKKVKTFLASIMIILASAVLTACSCSGDGGGTDDNTPQIPVSAITITSDFDRATQDSETGYLNITCNVGEEFNITYNLAPDNTTRTQVDWDFEDGDSAVVTKKNYSTYSQGVTHTVTFLAKNEGSTTIKFKPKNTDKWTQANVIVGKAKSTWPSFVKVTGLRYNSTTGKVVWNAVSQMKLHTGETVNVSTNADGSVSGLSGYIVSYKNITAGDTEYTTTPYNQPISANEYELPRGYTYEISVYARGDDFSMKDGPASDTFKFHQLATVTELKNNNGEISFVSPEYAEQNRISYLESDQSKFITEVTDGKANVSFIAGERFDKAERYNISIVSYPKNYATATVENGESFVYNEGDGVRYYPSVQSEALVVENLISPTISVEAVRGVNTVQGVTFGTESSINNPYLSTLISWKILNKSYSDEHQIKYAYYISKKTGSNWVKLTPSSADFATGTSFDLSQLTPASEQYKITVYAYGNPNTTIASSVTELFFHLQSPMNQAMVKPDDSTIITNTTLTTVTANAPLYGVDLYFINKDDSSKSVYKFYTGAINGNYQQKQMSIDIASLNLEAGNYDIYGRFVGINSGKDNISSVGELSKLNNNTVIVATPVRNANMTNSGILSFAKVTGIDEYQINFTQTQMVDGVRTTDSFASNIISTDATITVDVYELIKAHLLEKNGIDTDNLEEKFRDYTTNSNISLTITSIGVDQVGINSAPTNRLSFTRHNVVDTSTIALNYNTLTFTSPNNSATYVVEIAGRKYITPVYTSGATVEVDLNNARITTDVESERNTNLIDYVNKSTSTTIKIWALGGGASTNGSGIGYVDGYAVSKVFNCSSLITTSSIQMDASQLGNLMWNLDEDFDTPQEFNLTIYTKVGGNWQFLKTINIKDIYPTTDTSSGEGSGEPSEGGEPAEGEGGEPETYSLSLDKYYTYNILNAISDIPADTNIAITITHVVSDRFTNVESEKYYLIQLPQVQVSRCLDGTTPAITFASTAGITYQLNITNTITGAIETKTYTAESSDTTRVIHLSDLGIADADKAGVYDISIYAYKVIDSETENAETNPCALSGLAGSVNVQIVKQAIAVSANDQNIFWNTLNSATSYYVEYQKPGDTYTFIMNGSEHKLFTNDNLSHDVWQLFGVGENKVRVTPVADYVNSGVFLVGDVSENIIKKLNTISSPSVTDGVIEYNLIDSFDNNNYNISIKIGEEKLLAGEYQIDYANATISILSSKYIGTKNYSIQVTSSGAISSEYSSTISATKILAVSDIAKVGDYITFTPVDGASIYLLTFEDSNGENKITKRIRYVADEHKIQYEYVDGENTPDWREITNSDIAKFDTATGKIYLNFYDELFGIDISNSGIYYYSITAQTDIAGYLNGNVSSKYQIAKLSHSVGVNIDAENFVLSNYVRTEDDLQIPQSLDYSIVYSKNMSVDNDKPADGWTDITWEFDPAKFDANCSVTYIVTFYTVGDSPKEFAQTYLFDSADHSIKVFKAGDSEATPAVPDSYENVGYLSATENSGKWIIKLSKDQMTSSEVNTALEGTPDKVRIEYVQSKVVYTNSVPYSTVNIEGEGNSYVINLNTLNILDDGEYVLKIQFIGDNNQIISSEIVTSEVYTKLPASTLQTVSGVLSWSNIESASNYTIKVTCDPLGAESEGEEITEWTFANYTPSTEDATALPNISEDDLRNLDESFLGFETGRNYYIQIMANSNTNLSSKWSDTFTIQKLQAPTNINVKSTGKIIVNDGQETHVGEPLLTWNDPNSVANRPNYKMWIGDEEKIIYNTTSESSVLTGQILPSDIVPGTYEIAMCTIGNTTSGTDKIGLLTSDRSASNPQVTYVTETTNVSFENDSFTWVPVAGAYTYKLTFYKGSFSQSNMFATAEKVFTTFTTGNSYSFSATEFDGVGYYTVLVNAYCDPSIAVVSTYEATNGEGVVEPYDRTNCTNIYKSTTIERLMVKDGLIAWTLNMSDISSFLEIHHSIEGDKLIEYFGEQITSNEPETRRKQLLSAVVAYISGKINSGKEGDAEVDKILSNLFTFKAIINGVETVVTPTTVDPINITGTTEAPVYTPVSNANDATYLMFKYDMTSAPIEEGATSTSRFVIQIAPKGNYTDTNSTGLIGTVDGKFTTSITVYKPKTPRAVNINDTTEGAEGISGGTRKQISNGDLYWALVTNEDSTFESFSYHNKYKITARLAGSDNGSGATTDTVIEKKVDITDTQSGSENANLKDGVNYYRNLKDLFKDNINNGQIKTNTSYKLQISVLGTEDSTVLSADDKIYLNSNIFEYTDIMNILKNIDSSVTDGQYKYTPCNNISTQTRVVVYGPFLDDNDNIIYAPDKDDRSTWAWTDVQVDGSDRSIDYSGSSYDYEDALAGWKYVISPIWDLAVDAHWLGDYVNMRYEYTFEESSSSDGETTSVSRTTSFSLTGDSRYGAGSYIIRKQEIGNGRGIIDTEYTEDIVDGASGYLNLDYEEIATKLDVSTKATNIWVDDGRFVWKKVPRANAYKIFIEKLDANDLTEAGSYTDIVISDSSDANEYFDMPENSIYNEDGYVYRITITATHLENDHNTISPNYFEGENVTTDTYSRAPIPDNLNISEQGVVSWNVNTYYDAISKFEIRVNGNGEGTVLLDKTVDNNYDLSPVPYGTFDFSIRARGKKEGTTAYLNSCYNPALTIIKLTNPRLEIVNGKITWGTDTTEGMGEQPTKTEFKLRLNSSSDYLENTILDEQFGSYILHTEITDFDAQYNPISELGADTYHVDVKYRGTTRDNISNADTEREIIIASAITPLVATKLAYPTQVESIDVIKNGEAENRIRWARIANAGGYRALVITVQDEHVIIFDITETYVTQGEDVGYQTNIVIYKDGEEFSTISEFRAITATDDNYYMEYSTSSVDLRINKVIKALDLDSANGLSLDVYVQAIGSLGVSSTSIADKYISSSFSQKKRVEIPPMPTGIAFDSSTGTLSWNTDTSAGHNARITMTYEVSGVSASDFENYWKATADTIKVKNSSTEETFTGHNANRYSEITSRYVEYEVDISVTPNIYKVYVTDTVFIDAIEGKYTPTSYQVTNIGTRYTFTVRILTGGADYTGKYMSDAATLASTDSYAISFHVFEYGDGSELLPYGVKNNTMFNSIRYYTNAHYVITDDITFKDTDESDIAWDVIDTFTGYIDGQNHTVENLIPEAITIRTQDGLEYYQAIIRDNKGTIKDLNLTISNSLTGTIVRSTIYLAGLAYISSGTIDNVHITTFGEHINASMTGTLYNTKVAGLVNVNQGTITNSSVVVADNGTISALDNNNSTSKLSTYVAGLVNVNSGTIHLSYFSGNLLGNMVGGLVNENQGTISNSYSLGNAIITDTGVKTITTSKDTEIISSNVVGKGVGYGGISGSIYGNASIINCYSRMTLAVNIKDTNDFNLVAGGIVGSIESKKDTDGKTITNNITIANCYTVYSAYYYKLVTILDGITTVDESQIGSVNNTTYVVAPYVNSGVTYNNNYYVIESVTSATNITPANSESVATNAINLASLRDYMIAIKDDGNDVYYLPEREEFGTNKTSLYPMLVGNCESNFVTQD